MGSCPLFAVFVLMGCSGIYPALAALPDLVVRISPTAISPSDALAGNDGQDDTSIEILAKRAQFGSRDIFLKGTLVRPPGYDFFLCERFRSTVDVKKNGQVNVVTLPPYTKPEEGNSTVMLVPRGECSLERKAYAAKHFYGAKAIMIYDRLGYRYSWNESSHRVNFPSPDQYECANGNSMLYDLPLDPQAYNETQLDPIMGLATKMPTKPASSIPTTGHEELSGEGPDARSAVGMSTICNLTNTALKPCESQLCLVTSHLENSTSFPVCCAWDTPQAMSPADDAKDLNTNDILAVWLTIRQSELIFQSDLLSSGAEVSIKTRGSSYAFNVTYVFMWIWGTLVMMVGARYAAGDYRKFGAKLTVYKASKDNERTYGRDKSQSRPRRKKSGQPNEHPISESDEPASLQNNSNVTDERGNLKNEGLHNDLESGNRSFQIAMDGKIAGENSQRTKKKKRNTKTKKEKRTTEQNDKVWSLHSLPPPERKRKQKRSRWEKSIQSGCNTSMKQPKSEEEVGNESSIVPAREIGTITPFEMTQWHVVGK